MGVLVTNNAWGELSVGIIPTSSQLLLTGGQGDRFPNATENVSWFYATLCDAENNIEIVKVTDRKADTFQIERGADGTTPREFKQGAKVELRPCAALFNEKVGHDVFESKLKELETSLKAEDDKLYTHINSAIDEIKKDYITTEEVEKKFEALKEENEDLYLTIDEAKETYLPLEGGTLTGALTVTSEEGKGFTVKGGDIVVRKYIDPETKHEYGGNLQIDGALTAETLRSSSDARLKKNVEAIPDGLGVVLLKQFNPVTFNWKRDDSRDAGFIAQDLLGVVPYAVRPKENGLLTVSYQSLIPVLAAAVKDLIKEVEELKKWHKS